MISRGRATVPFGRRLGRAYGRESYTDLARGGSRGTLRVFEANSQKGALGVIGDLIQKGTVNPLVRDVSRTIIDGCDSRDDECEIQSIFAAVKCGHPDVPGMEDGFKYVSDPRWADFFQSAERTLQQLARGVNGGDCDDHTILIASLLGAIGYRVGARAWGPGESGEFEHVYAVCAFPKHPKHEMAVGLDTTVPESEVGWEPPPGPGRGLQGKFGDKRGHIETAWIE